MGPKGLIFVLNFLSFWISKQVSNCQKCFLQYFVSASVDNVLMTCILCNYEKYLPISLLLYCRSDHIRTICIVKLVFMKTATCHICAAYVARWKYSLLFIFQIWDENFQERLKGMSFILSNLDFHCMGRTVEFPPSTHGKCEVGQARYIWTLNRSVVYFDPLQMLSG